MPEGTVSVREVAAAIEEIAPAALAEEWDNVGTLVDCGNTVSSILVSLDVTDEVVAEAEALGCQLIVAHHPVIFRPMRSIARGQLPFKLVRKNISVLCAHSNLDAAVGGVNDTLAAIFGLEEPRPFGPGGRLGRLKEQTDVEMLARFCARKFGAHVRYCDTGRPVRTLAVLGGSGGSYLEDALAAGADCLLTGEADHHDAIEAKQAGMSTVVAGHFHTEFPVVPVLADWLAKKFAGVKVQVSRRNKDPFTHVAP